MQGRVSAALQRTLRPRAAPPLPHHRGASAVRTPHEQRSQAASGSRVQVLVGAPSVTASVGTYAEYPLLHKLTWLALGADHEARSRKVEQLMAL